ncbi:response regulator transcription factor [Sinanaerobacter chloroacetimidivorans]|jgi:DNA-binding response OmpR family regulator|uniref:Stage 0 sporulation protein A homolog n=1 Tax=Sinanaerobacter chloroacetimidivorans TaxID=2818044 RepID=A0A8J8B2H9_9FIRM|nr:response regulator transcription factor [Sinanaerobacter chloroacetimidivorans]MBR0598747.1 response regulator transcription factor [Sinanaerobacter chloroacetimidivorans]
MREEKKKVLIVDDEAKILDVVKSFLETKGYIVYSAENGREAFQIFDRENIALVILDLMLPDMSGEEICMEFRKKSRVPIIMLTAKSDEEDMLTGLSIGADDYLTKPFSLKELSARMDAILRRSGNDLVPLYKRNSFREGELEVDFEGRSIRKNGMEVNLTPNEFKLLAALIKYPNRVFTREDLISVALGDEFEGYDRAVDSHIKNIRQKIESDSKNPVYILTVHGVGYKFGGK